MITIEDVEKCIATLENLSEKEVKALEEMCRSYVKKNTTAA